MRVKHLSPPLSTPASCVVVAMLLPSVVALAVAWLPNGGESRLQAADVSVEKFTTESLRGRVVFTAEAMARLHGAKSVPEAVERGLALETSDGRLVPLLEDVRGRAFRADERLRHMKVELLVRRYPNSPVVQIVTLYEISADGKFEIDYWCDVCAIAMFELKTCECCQGEIELRRRRVVEADKPASP